MPKIIYDYRERSSGIIKELVKHEIEIEEKTLNSADFIIPTKTFDGNIVEVGIERKSISSETPVIIKKNKEIKIIDIKESFNLFKKNNSIKVMGLNFKTNQIGWFDVYDVTKHNSNNIYTISTSPKVNKKYENEENFNIKVTSGHNLYIFRKKKILCLPTEKLQRGDYIIIVPPRLERKNIKFYSSLKEFLENVQSDSIKNFKIFRNTFKLGSASSKYKIPKFDENFYFILGLWVAEGRYENRNLNFSQKTEKRNLIIEKYFKKVFKNFSKGVDFYMGGGKTYYYLFKNVLNLNSGSQNKEIPSIVFNSKESLKCAFIKGYLFGDGFINNSNRKNPQIMVSSKSKALIVGLSYLLFSLGIENNVHLDYKTYKKERRKYFLLRIKTISLKDFIQKIGQIPTKEIKINKTISTKIPYYFGLNIHKGIKRLNKLELIYFYNELVNIKDKKLEKLNFIKFSNIINKINLKTNSKYEIDYIKNNIQKIFNKVKDIIGLDSLFLLSKMYQNEIFLQRIYNIKKINKKEEVYDFSVKYAENFVGGLTPILLHNTQNDFLNSIIDKRILNQLILLKENFSIPLLIIEGEDNIYQIRNFHPNSIRGMLASIAIDYQIPILQTKNPRDTASLLVIIANRLEKPRKNISLLDKRKPITLKEQQEYIIESLPSVGPILAKALLKKFKNVKKIINASEDKLKKVDKIGDKKAKEISKVVRENYH